MIQKNKQYWFFPSKKRYLLPYLSLGILIFTLNSFWSLNWWFKGYFILLEAQMGIVLLLFLTGKLGNWPKNKNISEDIEKIRD